MVPSAGSNQGQAFNCMNALNNSSTIATPEVPHLVKRSGFDLTKFSRVSVQRAVLIATMIARLAAAVVFISNWLVEHVICHHFCINMYFKV